MDFTQTAVSYLEPLVGVLAEAGPVLVLTQPDFNVQVPILFDAQFSHLPS